MAEGEEALLLAAREELGEALFAAYMERGGAEFVISKAEQKVLDRIAMLVLETEVKQGGGESFAFAFDSLLQRNLTANEMFLVDNAVGGSRVSFKIASGASTLEASAFLEGLTNREVTDAEVRSISRLVEQRLRYETGTVITEGETTEIAFVRDTSEMDRDMLWDMMDEKYNSGENQPLVGFEIDELEEAANWEAAELRARFEGIGARRAGAFEWQPSEFWWRTTRATQRSLNTMRNLTGALLRSPGLYARVAATGGRVGASVLAPGLVHPKDPTSYTLGQLVLFESIMAMDMSFLGFIGWMNSVKLVIDAFDRIAHEEELPQRNTDWLNMISNYFEMVERRGDADISFNFITKDPSRAIGRPAYSELDWNYPNLKDPAMRHGRDMFIQVFANGVLINNFWLRESVTGLGHDGQPESDSQFQLIYPIDLKIPKLLKSASTKVSITGTIFLASCQEKLQSGKGFFRPGSDFTELEVSQKQVFQISRTLGAADALNMVPICWPSPGSLVMLGVPKPGDDQVVEQDFLLELKMAVANDQHPVAQHRGYDADNPIGESATLHSLRVWSVKVFVNNREVVLEHEPEPDMVGQFKTWYLPAYLFVYKDVNSVRIRYFYQGSVNDGAFMGEEQFTVQWWDGTPVNQGTLGGPREVGWGNEDRWFEPVDRRTQAQKQWVLWPYGKVIPFYPQSKSIHIRATGVDNNTSRWIEISKFHESDAGPYGFGWTPALNGGRMSGVDLKKQPWFHIPWERPEGKVMFRELSGPYDSGFAMGVPWTVKLIGADKPVAWFKNGDEATPNTALLPGQPRETTGFSSLILENVEISNTGLTVNPETVEVESDPDTPVAPMQMQLHFICPMVGTNLTVKKAFLFAQGMQLVPLREPFSVFSHQREVLTLQVDVHETTDRQTGRIILAGESPHDYFEGEIDLPPVRAGQERDRILPLWYYGAVHLGGEVGAQSHSEGEVPMNVEAPPEEPPAQTVLVGVDVVHPPSEQEETLTNAVLFGNTVPVKVTVNGLETHLPVTIPPSTRITTISLRFPASRAVVAAENLDVVLTGTANYASSAHYDPSRNVYVHDEDSSHPENLEITITGVTRQAPNVLISGTVQHPQGTQVISLVWREISLRSNRFLQPSAGGGYMPITLPWALAPGERHEWGVMFTEPGEVDFTHPQHLVWQVTGGTKECAWQLSVPPPPPPPPPPLSVEVNILSVDTVSSPDGALNLIVGVRLTTSENTEWLSLNWSETQQTPTTLSIRPTPTEAENFTLPRQLTGRTPFDFYAFFDLPESATVDEDQHLVLGFTGAHSETVRWRLPMHPDPPPPTPPAAPTVELKSASRDESTLRTSFTIQATAENQILVYVFTQEQRLPLVGEQKLPLTLNFPGETEVSVVIPFNSAWTRENVRVFFQWRDIPTSVVSVPVPALPPPPPPDPTDPTDPTDPPNPGKFILSSPPSPWLLMKTW